MNATAAAEPGQLFRSSLLPRIFFSGQTGRMATPACSATGASAPRTIVSQGWGLFAHVRHILQIPPILFTARSRLVIASFLFRRAVRRLVRRRLCSIVARELAAEVGGRGGPVRGALRGAGQKLRSPRGPPHQAAHGETTNTAAHNRQKSSKLAATIPAAVSSKHRQAHRQRQAAPNGQQLGWAVGARHCAAKALSRFLNW